MNKSDITFRMTTEEQRARALEKLDELVDFVCTWGTTPGQILFYCLPKKARKANEHIAQSAEYLASYIMNGKPEV